MRFNFEEEELDLLFDENEKLKEQNKVYSSMIDEQKFIIDNLKYDLDHRDVTIRKLENNYRLLVSGIKELIGVR